MPPAVLADSDDDGDGSSLEIEVPSVNVPAPVEEAPAAHGLDGTNERSTNSTDRLRKDIRSAERRLLDDSTKESTGKEKMQSSASPASQANKRRHTSAYSLGSVSPDKSTVKRTKTVETYATKRSSATAAHLTDDGFAAFREDGPGPAPVTSQSARFTENSGVNSSAGLSRGSIQKYFKDHEPAVMFRDTGSTAADGESSQQRMIEQALARSGLGTSRLELPPPDDHKSSTFPWSASQHTPLEKRPSSSSERPIAPSHSEHSKPLSQSAIAMAQEAESLHAGDQSRRADSSAGVASLEEPAHILPTCEEPQKLQSSPRVEITVQARGTKTVTPSKAATATAQQSTRGRKWKVQEDASDPLNSDERAIGFPKDLYVPRPSRRRATQLPEEQIDFSVIPERAARAKRTKTSAAIPAEPESAQSRQEAKEEVLRWWKETPTATEAISGSFSDATEVRRAPLKGSDVKRPEPEPQRKEGDTPKTADDEIILKPTPKKIATVSPVKTIGDDEIFVKPTPKQKASSSKSKAKRSHTTIFEDHVDFGGSQRTPSLRQRQAARHTALENTDSSPILPTKRQRRNVIQHEDEEKAVDGVEGNSHETLPDVTEAQAAKDDSAPKKRGRGSPRRETSCPASKSQEKVLCDSGSEGGDDLAADALEDEPPRKKGRGRPPKAATKEPSTVLQEMQQPPAQTVETQTDAQENEDHVVKSIETPTSPAKPQAATPSKPHTSSLQTPAPSPKQPTEASSTAKVSPAPGKGSATSHSPIKSSSAVPYRVGLSKRHRIPSLLRTMRPPKQ
jgi:hypothetical protein